MPISHIGLFIAIVLINHIAVLRVAATDELTDKALTCAPLCSGLLTGITLIISITALEWLNLYALFVPLLRILDHFIYLLIFAFVAHLLCVVCYKLKPTHIIPALFPIIVINSIGLGLLVLKINIGIATTTITLILAATFIATSCFFYYGNLCFSNIAPSKKLSITLLMAGIFALLFSGLIAFH
jgi:hypothetical protein